MSLRKDELEKIWHWMRTQLTAEDIEWLKIHRPGVWADFPGRFAVPPTKTERILFISWEIHNAEGIFDLSYRIQDVLDAKHKKEIIDYTFGDGLPKLRLIEIAQMLDVSFNRQNKWQLINKILAKIEGPKHEKEGGHTGRNLEISQNWVHKTTAVLC